MLRCLVTPLFVGMPVCQADRRSKTMLVWRVMPACRVKLWYQDTLKSKGMTFGLWGSSK